MAEINTTRQFFYEVAGLCTAFEAMQPWVDSECSDVAAVQRPLIRALRDALDRGDSVCGPDDILLS